MKSIWTNAHAPVTGSEKVDLFLFKPVLARIFFLLFVSSSFDF